MGTLTLDQLLDATGVSEMAGTHLKEASDESRTSGRPDFSKLADRCRRAVDDHDGPAPTREARDLVEKTAAVEIIRRTLAEVSGLGDSEEIEKMASGGLDHAKFIQNALAEGHPPEEIARFLEKAAAVSIPPGTKPVVQGKRVLKGPAAMLPKETPEPTKRLSGTSIIR